MCIVCFYLFWYGCVFLSFGISFLFFLTHCFICLFALVFLSAGPFALFCHRLRFLFFHLALLRWFALFVDWQWGQSRICVCFPCGGPVGNEQMAHSQIVVAIAFSLIFEMDVALVFHRRRPFGNAGFNCRFSITVYHHLVWYVIVCFCLGMVAHFCRSFFFECGGFCICFAIGWCRLCLFSSVCFRLFGFLRFCIDSLSFVWQRSECSIVGVW